MTVNEVSNGVLKLLLNHMGCSKYYHLERMEGVKECLGMSFLVRMGIFRGDGMQECLVMSLLVRMDIF